MYIELIFYVVSINLTSHKFCKKKKKIVGYWCYSVLSVEFSEATKLFSTKYDLYVSYKCTVFKQFHFGLNNPNSIDFLPFVVHYPTFTFTKF